jgi:hypothetical protein
VNRVPGLEDHVATPTEIIIVFILIEALGVFYVHLVKHYRQVQ